MLLPLAHEKMSLRRMPVVTAAIIFVTILLHVVFTLSERSTSGDAMRALVEARAAYVARPSLGQCKALEPFMEGEEAPAETPLTALQDRFESAADKEKAAADYAAACSKLEAIVASLPSYRFGYMPAHPRIFALVTYMFVHVDIWHVLGNMWFLFLCGLALEDRWGRLAFPAYYLVGGIVAAGVHHVVMPNSTNLLVGASGAVAGAMGAFLVLFATTKIRLVALLGFRPLFFQAPAYVMLPRWLMVELGFGLLGKASGTAHWAHVGGFAFGVVVAGALRIIGIDRRLDDASERAAVLGDDPRVDAAREMIERGDAKDAVPLLEGLAEEKPTSLHVWEALVAAAAAVGDEALEARAKARFEQLAEARGYVSVRGVVVATASATATASASATASAAAGASTATDEAAPFFPVPAKKPDA